MRFLSAFGRFWYGFLVGDRPELLVGPIVALAVVAFAVGAGVSSLGSVLLFALVVASGGWGLASDLRGIRRAAPAEPARPLAATGRFASHRP